MKTMIHFMVIALSLVLLSCGGGRQTNSSNQTTLVQDSSLVSGDSLIDPLYQLGELPVSGSDSALLASLRDSVPVTFHVWTSDNLYYKGERYLPMESPLKRRFKRFKDFFPFVPFNMYMYGLESGYNDKTYDVYWLLQDDRLYLADLGIFVPPNAKEALELIDAIEKYPGIYAPFTTNNEPPKIIFGHTWEEIYRMLERHTGSHFDRTIVVADSADLPLRFGLMPATWFNGSLFAKHAFIDPPHDDDQAYTKYIEWSKQPFQQLIFEQGRLLRVVNRPNSSDAE